jgi:hypothetical protein
MRDRLPALLAEIAEIAGLEAALAIADAKGGILARIPSRLTANNWLVKAVGMEKAEIISMHFTSGRGRIDLDIPLPPTNSHKQYLRQRAKGYEQALARTDNIFQAARMAGTTRRTIQRFNVRSATGNPPIKAVYSEGLRRASQPFPRP